MNVTSKLFNHLTVLVVLCLCVTLTGCGNSDSGGSGTASAPTNLSPEKQKEAMNDVLKKWTRMQHEFQVTTYGSRASNDQYRAAVGIFKRQFDDISLTDCPKEFTDALTTLQKAAVELMESELEAREREWDVESSEKYKSFIPRVHEADDQFLAVIQKFELEIPEM